MSSSSSDSDEVAAVTLGAGAGAAEPAAPAPVDTPTSLDGMFEDDDSGDENEGIDGESSDKGGTSPLSLVLGVACFPFTLCCSWYTVKEREEVVVLNYGKYTGTVKDSGVHFTNCFGRDLRHVSTQNVSLDLPNTKVVDLNGNPLEVSGIVIYKIENTKRAALDVTSAHHIVLNQAQSVMRSVVARFPYEHMQEGATGPTLKGNSSAIGDRLVSVLQKKVNMAGARIISFQFNEISYAPEIAQGMLKRQQAQATVAARHTIVKGAVDIAYGALHMLEQRGVTLDPTERGRSVSNLLIVLAGEGGVQPTLNVRS